MIRYFCDGCAREMDWEDREEALHFRVGAHPETSDEWYRQFLYCEACTAADPTLAKFRELGDTGGFELE